MDNEKTSGEAVKGLASEFDSWQTTAEQTQDIMLVKRKFDGLLELVQASIPPHNGRYKSIVATKLEEACMFAVFSFLQF